MATSTNPLVDARLISMIDDVKNRTAIITQNSLLNSERSLRRLALELAVFSVQFVKLVLKLRKITDYQDKLLSQAVGINFSNASSSQIQRVACWLDKLVEDEEMFLDFMGNWPTKLKIFLPIAKLAEQVEHFDSLSESLHLTQDKTGSALLVTAVEQFAMK